MFHGLGALGTANIHLCKISISASLGGTVEMGQSLSTCYDVFALVKGTYEDLASELGHSLSTYGTPDIANSKKPAGPGMISTSTM